MKVLLVDDHPLILSALQTMIHRLDPAVTVLSAENAVDGFELLAQQPDVGLVLLDLDLGDEVDGFTVLAEMRHRHPSLPVVVLSAAERLADMVRAVDMGAMGFLPKRSAIKDLFDVVGGKALAPRRLAQRRWPMPWQSLAPAGPTLARWTASWRCCGRWPIPDPPRCTACPNSA